MLYPFSRLCRPGRSPASCGPALHRKMGFNLIESAIVLGVVGLVIGGIWVAATAVNEHSKINRTLEGLIITARNIQSLISVADSGNIGAADITSTVLSAEAFPADWVVGGSIKTPFGGSVTVTNSITVTGQGSGPRFSIWLYGFSPSACIEFLVKLSGIAAMSGSDMSTEDVSAIKVRTFIRWIYINYPSYGTTEFPIPSALAASKCNQSSNSVVATFSYARTI